MEELFGEVEEQTHERAEDEGDHYFDNRIYDDGNDIDVTVLKCFSDTEGDSEDHKTHDVVKRDNGQEHTCERAVGFILFNYHESSGGCGGCSDSSEGKDAGEGELIGEEEVNDEEGDIDGYSSDESLENSDDDSLFTGFFQLREAELVTHSDGDETECDVTDDTVGGDVVGGNKSYAGDTEFSEAIRTDEDTCDEVSGDCGEVPDFSKSGEHKTREEGDGQSKKSLHG